MTGIYNAWENSKELINPEIMVKLMAAEKRNSVLQVVGFLLVLFEYCCYQDVVDALGVKSIPEENWFKINLNFKSLGKLMASTQTIHILSKLFLNTFQTSAQKSLSF